MRAWLAGALMFVCAACAGSRAPAVLGDPVGPEAAAFGEIVPRTLPADECWIVLLSREATPRRIFVGYWKSARGHAAPEGRETVFLRESGSGASAFGLPERQVYQASSGETVAVDVRYEPYDGRQRGAAVRSGSIAYTDRVGVSTILPVVGLVACGDRASPA